MTLGTFCPSRRPLEAHAALLTGMSFPTPIPHPIILVSQDQCDVFASAFVTMAILFRPWMQPDAQQDHTISTTTSECSKEDTEVPRDVKFKCIKEHMKKRSEKKCRRLRAGMHSKVEPISSLPAIGCPPILPAQTTPFPVLPSKCFDVVEASYRDCWDDLTVSSPELVEAALSQGVPPALLEEYVRVLAEQQRQISERNRKQRPKKFRCPHCQVGFSNNGQLKGHIRIHTGERPFKCDAEHCGKSFTRNEELTRHRRIHSGLRPFPCPECGKRFGRKDHLKKHIRTHYHQRYQLVPILPSHYPYLLGL